jgi:hypothetical protein
MGNQFLGSTRVDAVSIQSGVNLSQPTINVKQLGWKNNENVFDFHKTGFGILPCSATYYYSILK